MEALHHLFHTAERQGMISPLTLGHPIHNLSLFAYDVMLFLKPTFGDVQVCSVILEDFGHATGLHINHAKCRGLVTADVLEKGLSRGAIAMG
jgi:hypothetical protein